MMINDCRCNLLNDSSHARRSMKEGNWNLQVTLPSRSRAPTRYFQGPGRPRGTDLAQIAVNISIQIKSIAMYERNV
eukprot:scaffold167_cov140-Skeletonema_menzelii.AAC.11